MDYFEYSREQLVEMIVELKMLNKELLAEKEAETKLDFAWSGNLGHWYYNIKTNSVVFNPLKVQALGYTMEEVSDKVSYAFFTDKLHPEDYQPTMEAMKRHMKGEIDVYEVEYRIRAKDGSWKWFYDRGKITQRNKAGEPEFAAGIVFDITEKKEAERCLKENNQILTMKATTDPLTRIRNRGAIMEELENRIEQARNNRTPLTVALIDLDHFKRINDTLGHLFGDDVLKTVAQVISQTIRGLDSVGRYGGEEFLLILPNTGLDHAFQVCKRIGELVRNLDFGEGVKVTLSGGIAPFQGEKLEDLLRKADEKLYDAKGAGRDQFKI